MGFQKHHAQKHLKNNVVSGFLVATFQKHYKKIGFSVFSGFWEPLWKQAGRTIVSQKIEKQIVFIGFLKSSDQKN